jgi:hypothetical protein
MTLSNAERQKRHREKLKALAKIGAAMSETESGLDGLDEGLADRFADLLRTHYIRGGVEHLDAVDNGRGDAIFSEAREAFLSTKPISLVDMLDLMEQAGAKAVSDIVQKIGLTYMSQQSSERTAALHNEPVKVPKRRKAPRA